MAGDGSWRATSLLEEERAVLVDSNHVYTPKTEDSDDTDPYYTPAEHPFEPSLSPDYTSAGLELLSSKYEPEEDTATSPPHPTPSHIY